MTESSRSLRFAERGRLVQVLEHGGLKSLPSGAVEERADLARLRSLQRPPRYGFECTRPLACKIRWYRVLPRPDRDLGAFLFSISCRNEK